MSWRRPSLAAVTLLVVSFGVTGCRVANDRTATVTEPEPGSTGTSFQEVESADDPAGTTTSTVLVTPSGSLTRPSEQEIEELERELDEIDQLLSDTERAFTED